MNMRKITSLTALVSFALLIMSSVILYIVPSGRVAYWAGYRFWFLSKEDWGNVHINLGFLLLLSIVLHIYYNWTPLLNYMKNRSQQLRIFTFDFNIALLLTLVVFFGTLSGIPPMSGIINLGAVITDKANVIYGEPPYGHAELSSLADFVDKVKLDLDESLVRLKAAGIKIDSSVQTMNEIALKNGMTPQQIYQVLKPEQKGGVNVMAAEAPGGTGSRTLAQICDQYQLDQDRIVRGLASMEIAAQPSQVMKEIAAANSLDPHAVYAAIYLLGQKTGK